MDAHAIELDDHPELEELERLLAEGKTCRITRHGRTVGHVTPANNRFADWKPSPEQLAALRSSLGGWANNVDLDEFLRNTYSSRDLPSDRPVVQLRDTSSIRTGSPST